MRALLVTVIGMLSTAAWAAEEPSADELCQAISETSSSALQPRDRLFFQKNCECVHAMCASKGSTRHGLLRAAVKCEAAARKRMLEERPGVVELSEEALSALQEECMRSRSAKKAYARGVAAQQELERRIAEQARAEQERSEAEWRAEEKRRGIR